MLKKINKIFSSIKMTIVSGIFLLLSVVLLILKKNIDISLNCFLDPAIITIIISGYPIAYEAFESLFEDKKITSELLVTIAIIASLFIKEIIAAGEVAFIMTIGETLEDLSLKKSKKGIDSLMKLKPKIARVISGDEEVMVECEKLKINDLIRVLPGEEVPIDCVITQGFTSINQSILTGESLPVDKKVGDECYGGTINEYGSIDAKVIREFKDSSLEKMIDLLTNVKTNDAKIKKTADRLASFIVPISLLIALSTFIITYLGFHYDLQSALIRGTTILVVFCPCALSLATPTAIIASIGQAAKYGVLIKSGSALEKISKITAIAFDKTGTLTEGKLEVTDIMPFIESKNELLKIVSSIENMCTHPISKAIVAKAKEESISFYAVDDFLYLVGKGLKGTINGTTYFLGNEAYAKDVCKDIDEKILTKLNSFKEKGKIVVVTIKNNEVIGVIALSDKIRSSSNSTIGELNKMGYEIYLLTGDNYKSSKYIGEKIGISNIKSDLLPEEKAKVISELRNAGEMVAMVGEGINDAPSLKTADVSIALGKNGSDISIDTAEITLMDDDIKKIPYLFKLSIKTVKTIKLSLILSLIINFIAAILSIIGMLTPVTGAIVHNVSSVLIILNASILYEKKIK